MHLNFTFFKGNKFKLILIQCSFLLGKTIEDAFTIQLSFLLGERLVPSIEVFEYPLPNSATCMLRLLKLAYLLEKSKSEELYMHADQKKLTCTFGSGGVKTNEKQLRYR